MGEWLLWISERSQKQTVLDGTAQLGYVTLPGDPVGVYLDGERRNLPLYGPGGYTWRPSMGDQVLVIKTGADGETPCVVNKRCRQVDLQEGEILISTGNAAIRLSPNGVIDLTGTLKINGQEV